ncbi:unnamed protein product, partial [Ixodes hexagonus]
QAWILYTLFYGYLRALRKTTVLVGPDERPSLTASQTTRTPWEPSSLRAIFGDAFRGTRHPPRWRTSREAISSPAYTSPEASRPQQRASGSDSPLSPLEQWFGSSDTMSPVTATAGQPLHVVPNRSRSVSYTWSRADAAEKLQAKESSFDAMQHEMFTGRSGTVSGGSDDDSFLATQRGHGGAISPRASAVCVLEAITKDVAPLLYISGTSKRSESVTPTGTLKSPGS